MRVVVFGGERRARLVARTLRAFAARGVTAVELARAPQRAAVELAGGGWLVRAGAWPCVDVGAALAVPSPSSTGRPLVAIGRPRPPHGEHHVDDTAWLGLAHASGGDLDTAGPLPALASAFVDASAAERIAEDVGRGVPCERALAEAAHASWSRTVRVAALDVFDSTAVRVAVVITTLQQGGAERIAVDLTRALRTHARVLLIALGRSGRRMLAPPAGTLELAHLPRERRAAAARTAVLAFGADVVHAHLVRADEVRAIAGELPLVVTVHNSAAGWPADLLDAAPAVYIACSRAVEDELRAHGVAATRTIHNATDPARALTDDARMAARHALRVELQIAEDALVVLAVANPRPQKRLERLPEIVREVAARVAPRRVSLVVAGAPLPNDPRSLAADAALRDAIARDGIDARVVGSRDDTHAVYAAADVLVSTSAWEGLSVALLEALAAGVPAVVTDVGGAREIESEAVALVDRDAPATVFADAIVERARLRLPRALPHAFTVATAARRHARLLARAAIPRRPGRGVWLVANNFSTGGAQSSARRLLAGLVALGVPARAAVLQEAADRPTLGTCALRAAGVPVLAAPLGAAAPAVDAVLAAIDDDPPEAVLFWNAIAEHKLLLADALLGVRVFDVSPGEMFYTSLERYFERPRADLAIRTPRDYGRLLAGVIVKYAAEAPRAAGLGAPVHVVPNGVPIPRAVPDGHVTGPLVIGTAARISPQKKLEQLIDAVRLAAPRLPRFVVRVAGRVERDQDGYASELQQRATGLPIEWLGEVSDIPAFLAAIDVFAAISEPAGCPNATLEAMAHARAIIATDFGGASEQIEDGATGRLVARGDPDAFAEALVALAGDRDRARSLGRAARARAVERFDVARMVADYRRVCLRPDRDGAPTTS